MSKLIEGRPWLDSEITHNYPSPYVSIPRGQRFKLHSIYWPEPDDPSKMRVTKKRSLIDQEAARVSKLIDQELKNEERIGRSLRAKSDFRFKHTSPLKANTKAPKIAAATEQIVLRLARTDGFKAQSTLRDRHGNRCSLFSDFVPPNIEDMSETANKTSRSMSFRTSNRIKLQLPHNFNPGPGTYCIPRFLQK